MRNLYSQIIERAAEQKEWKRALHVSESRLGYERDQYGTMIATEIALELSIRYRRKITVHYRRGSKTRYVCCIEFKHSSALYCDVLVDSFCYFIHQYRININPEVGIQQPPYGPLYKGKIPHRHQNAYNIVMQLDRDLQKSGRGGLLSLGQRLIERADFYITRNGAVYIDTKRSFYMFIWYCNGYFPKVLIRYLGHFVFF